MATMVILYVNVIVSNIPSRGPYSGGSFDWALEGGDIRFVAGNSMEAAGESVTIEYTYNAHLSLLLGSILTLVGGVQIFIGWKF